MNNDEVYAGGLLTRALDPATQPPEIREFLRAECEFLEDVIAPGSTIVDLGCGTGRHLRMLSHRVGFGVGIDYEHSYIAEARRTVVDRHLQFLTADATAIPIEASFDFATCLTNTWGTMSDKAGVLSEMRRLAPLPRSRILCVYSLDSIPARREWYRRFEHEIVEESDDFLLTDGGLRSEHFSRKRIYDVVGDCAITPLADITYIVRF